MSWDISVFAAKAPPPPVERMRSDWSGEILGSAQEVREKISLCLPGVDWSDPTWGHFAEQGYSYEFNVGEKDPNDGFMIHVHGGGDAVGPLLRLAERWGWFLLDCSQGEWLHHCEDIKAGWQGFQAYRDSVLSDEPRRESPDAEN
jgi:hypothetical protein